MTKTDTSSGKTTETDLAQDIMGDNALQGDDQAHIRNQRHAVADVRQTPDDSVIESLKKMDKDVRAEKELGKGARKSEGYSAAHPIGCAKVAVAL